MSLSGTFSFPEKRKFAGFGKALCVHGKLCLMKVLNKCITLELLTAEDIFHRPRGAQYWLQGATPS